MLFLPLLILYYNSKKIRENIFVFDAMHACMFVCVFVCVVCLCVSKNSSHITYHYDSYSILDIWRHF